MNNSDLEQQAVIIEKILLQGWDLSLRQLRPEFALAGSPERCRWRSVVETETGRLWVLEEIDTLALDRKREIAAVLAYLADAGMPAVHPYEIVREGGVVYSAAGRHWQLRPYVTGDSLQRPDYAYEARRGAALAGFLREFHDKGRQTPHSSSGRPFSIKAFIYDLMGRINSRRRDLIPRLRLILDHLEKDFMTAHDHLPTAFCHGDYHPVNVIWEKENIASVIDWEFCGYKPELYDLSLLIGCIGMEDPHALLGPLVEVLLEEQRPVHQAESLGYLIEFVMAIRFAWLSEWLRGRDEDMVNLECDYLDILLREHETLKLHWLEA